MGSQSAEERDGRPDSSSPWPLFVAFGAVLAEIGVLFGFVPVAVAGVLLFGGSCAGILQESGYADTVWRPLRAVGIAIGAVAALVWVLRTPALTPQAFRTVAVTDPLAVRAAVVLGAAAVLLAMGVLVPAVATRR